MNKPRTELIPVDHIDVGARLRTIDMDWVQWIAVSMREMGQQTPIEVRPGTGGRYLLTAGAHRLAAVKFNRQALVEAKIVEVSDLEAELREIDENLFRRELSELDRSTCLARRQEVFWELHPETKRGIAGAVGRWMGEKNLSFASETGDKLRISSRQISRSIARFTKIVPDVREKIAGTWIADNGSILDALVRVEPSDQRRAVTIMLRMESPPKNVKAALAEINGVADAPKDVDAEQLAALQRKWKDAGRQAKNLFLDWLIAEGGVNAAWLDAVSGRKGA